MQRLNTLISQWVRPEIRAISAYHVPDPAGLIKLDAMENPYTWPDELRAEWAGLIQASDVNRYPSPGAPSVKARLRDSIGLADDMEILLGNGSDEIIQMLAMALGGPGRSVLSVEPGFVMYRMIATFTGMEHYGVPLRTKDFWLDVEAMLEAMERHHPAIVYIDYPNNPTGNLFDEAGIRRIIEAAPGVVVIDEAYAPFTDHSFLGAVGEHPNLLVMRTLSKMGLAGLRLGYLVGPRAWLSEIDKTRLPYNINCLTQLSAEFALRHQAVFDDQTRRIRAERERLFSALHAMDGVHAFPSQANFILARMPQGRAPAIHQGLKERGVLVKCLHGAHPSLTDCLRITVGTPEEDEAFLVALAALL